MISGERVKKLNDNNLRKGNFAVYWMQASQRVEENHALIYSIEKANESNIPLIVFFGLTPDFPEANRRHYYFMLEGLREVKKTLVEMGIKMVIRKVSPEKGIINIGKDASFVAVDRSYLRIQKEWRDFAAKRLKCPLIQIESDVVVPVETASEKEEYSARTFRPKIKPLIKNFLKFSGIKRPVISSTEMDFSANNIENTDKLIKDLNIDNSVSKSKFFKGGTIEAKKRLEYFIENGLEDYALESNDPAKNCISNLSPYLHFGQISPSFITREVMETNSKGIDAFLEQLIVRRELSMNFVFYNKNYDSLKSLPGWAKETLEEHKKDKREYVYTRREFEEAKTQDIFWNAAQKEMMVRGKMHGYMRMYWAKKILEWSKTPEEALKTALYLNNKYELDGRDPNGFTGVLWCFGKHDRAWKERPVVGKVRYMSSNGLKRKFDIYEYVEKVKKL